MNCSHEGKSEPKAATEPNNRNHQSTSSTAPQSSTSAENFDAQIIVMDPSITGVSLDSLQTSASPEVLSATSPNTDVAAYGQSIHAGGAALDESKVIEVLECSTSEHPEVKSEGTARMEGQGDHRQTWPKVAPRQVGLATPANTDTTASTIFPRNGQQEFDSNWNFIANPVEPILEEAHNQSTSSAPTETPQSPQAVEDNHDRLRGTSVGADASRNHQHKQPGPIHQNDSNGKPTTLANKQYHQKNAGLATRECHISQQSSNSMNHPTEMEDLQPGHEENSTAGTTEMEDLSIEHQETTEVEDRQAAQEENTTTETSQPLVCAHPIQP